MQCMHLVCNMQHMKFMKLLHMILCYVNKQTRFLPWTALRMRGRGMSNMMMIIMTGTVTSSSTLRLKPKLQHRNLKPDPIQAKPQQSRQQQRHLKQCPGGQTQASRLARQSRPFTASTSYGHVNLHIHRRGGFRHRPIIRHRQSCHL